MALKSQGLCLFLLMLLLLLGGIPTFAQKSLLVAGRSAGTTELGAEYGKVSPALGPALKVEPAPTDPNTQMYYHKELMLMVGNENKVIGITVLSNAYRTPDGLGLGSTEHEVIRRLGEGLTRGPGNRTYPSRGIGFSFDAAKKVNFVTIFKPEGDRPLLGDRLLVGGQRAGQLRLGMKFSVVEEAWGPPATTRDLGGGQRLVNYPNNSVKFVIHPAGTVDAILISTGDFITAQGLKVGVSPKMVQKVLGQCQNKVKNGLFYPKLGIGFLTESTQVTEIQILYPR